MNKQRNNTLMGIANEVLQKDKTLFNEGTFNIIDSFSGQIAALGVSIAMSGLLPSLAFYYKDKDSKNDENKRRSAVDRSLILRVIALMLNKLDSTKYENITEEDSLLKYAIKHSTNCNELKTDIEDCVVALKQIVRTYNLVKK